ncbi:hypothetical protein CDEST_04242 [Colletotrichum destructivum]|uniref:EC8 protein n=1 Tax=Colletotrichum destructivum TaxID=34406 RepID=A0AAX4I8I5_9PEZI|nr:hypothetical protein CDEST_04242 [Colletotrichum destructivum]
MVSFKSLLVATLVSSVVATPLKSNTSDLVVEAVDKVPEIEARDKANFYPGLQLPEASKDTTKVRISSADRDCSSAEKERLDAEIQNRYALKDRLDAEIKRREDMKDELDREIRTRRKDPN